MLKVEKQSPIYIQHVEVTDFKTNDNGKQMVNLSLGRDLTVMGTWCQHKDIHKVT